MSGVVRPRLRKRLQPKRLFACAHGLPGVPIPISGSQRVSALPHDAVSLEAVKIAAVNETVARRKPVCYPLEVVRVSGEPERMVDGDYISQTGDGSAVKSAVAGGYRIRRRRTDMFITQQLG